MARRASRANATFARKMWASRGTAMKIFLHLRAENVLRSCYPAGGFTGARDCSDSPHVVTTGTPAPSGEATDRVPTANRSAWGCSLPQAAAIRSQRWVDST